MKRFKNSKSNKALTFFEHQKETEYREKCKEKPRFLTIQEYTSLYPEFEKSCHPEYFKHFVNTRLILLSGYHTSMPGNYYTCHIQQYKNDPLFYVYLSDGNSWEGIKPLATEELALAEIENLKQLSPFCLSELCTYFGYE